jgi:hypothetical protein
MIAMLLFHGNGRNKLTVGKCYQNHKREKVLAFPSLCAGQFMLFVNQIDISPHFLCAAELKVNSLYSSVEPCSVLPLVSLSPATREVNLSVKAHGLGHVARHLK